MKELEKFETMSSREIAELTGKEHYHVIRDIEVMFKDLEIGASKFGGSYLSEQNKELKCYNLNYELTITLVSGYNTKLRNAIIKRWIELEAQAKSWGEVRLLTKDSYKRMSDELTKHRLRLGKKTSHFHYANEAKMINRIIGLPNKNNREELDKETLDKLDSLTETNRTMIMHDMPYDKRKVRLLEIATSPRLLEIDNE